MTSDNVILNCYTKPFPKWTVIPVSVVGIIVLYFLPPTSFVFYIWILLCVLFIYKTLSQKPEKEPVISILTDGIKLKDNTFYGYNDIKKVMAFSKNKFKFRSIEFKLFLNDGSHVDFSVDNLDVKPQQILDTINSNLKS
jgi:hypothetical protein